MIPNIRIKVPIPIEVQTGESSYSGDVREYEEEVSLEYMAFLIDNGYYDIEDYISELFEKTVANGGEYVEYFDQIKDQHNEGTAYMVLQYHFRILISQAVENNQSVSWEDWV